MPAAVAARPLVQGRTISWARDRLDGAAGYRLALEVVHGELHGTRIGAGPDGRIGLRITALSGETPLVPLPGAELLNDLAGTDSAARDTLTFLAYREKLLAGSWRFQTYFGRDTLLSVRLLMPVLSATAIEDALASVLARLSPKGEVAHEEDIGERAVRAMAVSTSISIDARLPCTISRRTGSVTWSRPGCRSCPRGLESRDGAERSRRTPR